MYMRTRCRFFYDVRAAANKAFPVKEGEAVTTGQVVINGFLFLRLFCPAIVAPQLYNLVDTDPDPRTSRILKVIARILQYLANFKTEIEGDIFTPDNARVVNAFLKDNQATMRSFIDTVCNRDKASLRVFGRVALPVDLERYGVGPGLRVWGKGVVGRSTHSGNVPFAPGLWHGRELAHLYYFNLRYSKPLSALLAYVHPSAAVAFPSGDLA